MKVTYEVNYTVEEKGKTWNATARVFIVAPPELKDDLMDALWIKLADRHPGAHVEITSFRIIG